MPETPPAPTPTARPPREAAPGDERAVDITILLPSYNEEAAIGPVIDEVRDVLGQETSTYEILVVDDKSRDRTAEIAEARGVRVVRRPANGGSGASRKTGIRAARGEIIVMLDADGSYNPADIPALLAHFPDFDQVNGARTSEEGTHKALRVPAKWMIRMLASYLARMRIPDLNTGLKAFKRSAMLPYLWVIPDGFSCVTSMTLAHLTNGHPVAYVPTTYRKRIGKSKFHPVKDTSRYMATVVRMIMYFKPLRVFGPAAATIFAAALVKTGTDLAVEGRGIQESTIIMLMTAIMIAMLGMLADLIVAQKKL